MGISKIFKRFFGPTVNLPPPFNFIILFSTLGGGITLLIGGLLFAVHKPHMMLPADMFLYSVQNSYWDSSKTLQAESYSWCLYSLSNRISKTEIGVGKPARQLDTKEDSSDDTDNTVLTNLNHNDNHRELSASLEITSDYAYTSFSCPGKPADYTITVTARRDDTAYNGLSAVPPKQCFSDATVVSGKDDPDLCLGLITDHSNSAGTSWTTSSDGTGVVTNVCKQKIEDWPVVRAWYYKDVDNCDSFSMNDPEVLEKRFTIITIVGGVFFGIGIVPMVVLCFMVDKDDYDMI